jgi:hypothetical protein
MPGKLYLVQCVSQKRNVISEARDLYTSPWFKKARAYVERNLCSCDTTWYVLSAKYRLVANRTPIESYDETLHDKPIALRNAWARTVWWQLRPLVMGRTIVFLAGVKYREHLIKIMDREGFAYEVPMEGLGIGQQLKWLKEAA